MEQSGRWMFTKGPDGALLRRLDFQAQQWIITLKRPAMRGAIGGEAVNRAGCGGDRDVQAMKVVERGDFEASSCVPLPSDSSSSHDACRSDYPSW